MDDIKQIHSEQMINLLPDSLRPFITFIEVVKLDYLEIVNIVFNEGHTLKYHLAHTISVEFYGEVYETKLLEHHNIFTNEICKGIHTINDYTIYLEKIGFKDTRSVHKDLMKFLKTLRDNKFLNFSWEKAPLSIL
jgi:hypothetical protein